MGVESSLRAPLVVAQQVGPGTNLDVSSGAPVLVKQIQLYCNTACGLAKVYDAVTASGNFIPIFHALDRWTCSHVFGGGGVRFANGLSLELPGGANAATRLWVHYLLE